MHLNFKQLILRLPSKTACVQEQAQYRHPCAHAEFLLVGGLETEGNGFGRSDSSRVWIFSCQILRMNFKFEIEDKIFPQGLNAISSTVIFHFSASLEENCILGVKCRMDDKA